MNKRKIVGVDKNAITQNVQAYLDKLSGIGAEKVAKTLSRAYSKDVKLNRFLAAAEKGFSAGLGLFIDAKRRESVLEAVQGHGITSPEQKQAAVIHVIQCDADAEVSAKQRDITDNGKLVLNDEQKAALVAALTKYRQFIIDRLMPGALDVAASLGVVAYEEVKDTAPVALAEE